MPPREEQPRPVRRNPGSELSIRRVDRHPQVARLPPLLSVSKAHPQVGVALAARAVGDEDEEGSVRGYERIGACIAAADAPWERAWCPARPAGLAARPQSCV